MSHQHYWMPGPPAYHRDFKMAMLEESGHPPVNIWFSFRVPSFQNHKREFWCVNWGLIQILCYETIGKVYTPLQQRSSEALMMNFIKTPKCCSCRLKRQLEQVLRWATAPVLNQSNEWCASQAWAKSHLSQLSNPICPASPLNPQRWRPQLPELYFKNIHWSQAAALVYVNLLASWNHWSLALLAEDCKRAHTRKRWSQWRKQPSTSLGRGPWRILWVPHPRLSVGYSPWC